MSKEYRCPACGERAGVNILYGMLGIEYAELEEKGEMALGGCVRSESDPERKCMACAHAWQIKRRGHLSTDLAVSVTASPDMPLHEYQEELGRVSSTLEKRGSS